MDTAGKVILGVGVLLVALGGLMVLLGQLGLGALPGDISFRRGNVRIFVPIGTSILLSIVLTILLNLFLRR